MPHLIAAGWLALAASGAFVQTGTVHDPELAEISGIAASRARPGLLWAHNDSGNAPAIFALDRTGQVQQRVAVRGARNVDWEDIAWFEEDGQPYLAIADIGDNLQWRSHLTLYIVPEPLPGAVAVKPVRRIEFQFEDGARDVEALAVDVRGGRFLMFEKQRPPGLYELPLHPADEGIQIARRIAVLPARWTPAPPTIESYGAIKFRNAPTAMDISRDGRRLLLLTYSHLLLFRRAGDEDWAHAIARAPLVMQRVPRIPGFEAGCFDADERSAWITREGLPAELFWFRQ
ncbi:MAG TPA: hypothetical protein VM074_01675 [Solimonas sp.]|nr:hypothetical protein [Solimonas sp.]